MEWKKEGLHFFPLDSKSWWIPRLHFIFFGSPSHINSWSFIFTVVNNSTQFTGHAYFKTFSSLILGQDEFCSISFFKLSFYVAY